MLKLNINNKFLSFVLIPQQLSVSILTLSTLSLQAFKHKQQVFKQLLIVQMHLLLFKSFVRGEFSSSEEIVNILLSSLLVLRFS
jgi:hypothetical protein